MKLYLMMFATFLGIGLIGAGAVISADQNLSKATFYVA